jgi:hypothetical protein
MGQPELIVIEGGSNEVHPSSLLIGKHEALMLQPQEGFRTIDDEIARIQKQVFSDEGDTVNEAYDCAPVVLSTHNITGGDVKNNSGQLIGVRFYGYSYK